MLATLRRHGVDFIVVGGVGAVLQGAPIATFDLDVVHSREERNLERLLPALSALEARYRSQPDRRPELSDLSSTGHQLLMTRFGPLDLLGAIGRGHDYTSLLAQSIEIEIDRGLSVRVLALDMLIRTKEEVATEKDRAVLAVLRRTLEEKSGGQHR